MNLSRSIAHNTAIQIIGKAISTALGLLAVAMMGRHLLPEQFGWYITATGFLQFIGILIDFGFTVTISNMLAAPEFDKERLFNTVFTWRLITAAIFFGLAPFLILFFPYRAEIKIAVAITSLSFFANTLNQVFIGYYRQKLAMMVATISEILGRLVLVGGIALLVLLNSGFLPIMGVITIASVSSSIYLWYKFGPIRLLIDRDISKALFYKMWPTGLSVIFNTIYLQADRVILPLYAPQTIVGFYGAAYRVLDIVTQVAAIVMGLIMPLITFSWSRNLWEDFRKRYQLGVDLLALILFPMVVGIFVLSDQIMQFIMGQSFAGAGLMLKWLSLSILGTSFGMTFGHIVLAINRQKEALLVYGSDAVLSLIGYFIFIPRYGWMGAVGVTIFSEIYAGIFLTVISVYYSKLVPHFKTMLKIILSSLLMGWLLKFFHLSLPLTIGLGMLAYTALVFTLRVVNPATVREIISFSEVAEN